MSPATAASIRIGLDLRSKPVGLPAVLTLRKSAGIAQLIDMVAGTTEHFHDFLDEYSWAVGHIYLKKNSKLRVKRELWPLGRPETIPDMFQLILLFCDSFAHLHSFSVFTLQECLTGPKLRKRDA